MSTENPEVTQEPTPTQAPTTFDPKDQEMLDRLIEEKAAEKLKETKKLLDNAYAERDRANAELAKTREKERQAELKKLEEEGKFKEAYELKLAAEQAKYNETVAKMQALEETNLTLTRDSQVKSLLSECKLRNGDAAEMAFGSIIANLVRNEQGVWVHKTGISVSDYVKAFASDDSKSFLFASKQSSGAGTTTTSPAPTTKKSLFSMSQADVLKMAAEGKL
jgi:hypothetical protein